MNKIEIRNLCKSFGNKIVLNNPHNDIFYSFYQFLNFLL